MIEGMQRALDVSFLESVLVPLEGRELRLFPQSAPQLERVLNAIHQIEDQEAEAGDEKKPLGTRLAKNFRRNLPILVMMFGLDPKSNEGKDLVQFLEENLPPKLAARIYEEWRRINEIEDFLLRGGSPTMHPEILEKIREMREVEMAVALSESIQPPLPDLNHEPEEAVS